MREKADCKEGKSNLGKPFSIVEKMDKVLEEFGIFLNLNTNN
jgi:hypothetical protein